MGRFVPRLVNVGAAAARRIARPGRRPRSVRTGAFRGLRLQLDLASDLQVYAGLFERELHPWLARFARGARGGIDAGAGAGEYAVFLLAKAGVDFVVAFEPDEEGRGLLRANLAHNGIPSRRCEIIAEFVAERDSPGARTLDSVLDRALFPCVVKIDVEGAEAAVLRGAQALLAAPAVSWIIETHSAQTEVVCHELLAKAGYTVRVVPQAWWRKLVPERRPLEHNRWLVAWRDDAPALRKP